MVIIRVLLAVWCMKETTFLKTMLLQEPDIEIVGEAVDNVDALLKVGSTRADIVAVDLPPCGKDPGLCSHLLAEYPDVKILALSEGGDKIQIYERAVVRNTVSSTSIKQLAKLIRSSVGVEEYHWDDRSDYTQATHQSLN